MPLWHHHHHGASSHGTNTPLPDSASPSRPSSPHRTTTRTSVNSNNSATAINIHRNSDTPSDSLNGDYFGDAGHLSPTNSYAPSSWSEMRREGSGTHAPSSQLHAPVEIILDSDRLVMRGQGGDMNPAYLSGRVELNLPEATNVKEIAMTLTGKAKVQFHEVGTGKNHHHTHQLMHHDWTFLEGDKRHHHTLKAGFHSFPFNLMLDGTLPATIATYNGEAWITYKLRATVIRAGFTAHNYSTTKSFQIHRTYTSDALEFNQTLEIENTWPGKIMYSLTLPFKAYAAGDDIPVIMKFMPLAKGVRVTAITSVLKEYTLVHTRHSSNPNSRVAASIRHEIRGGQAVEVSKDPVRPPMHNNGPSFSSHHSSALNSGRSSLHASPAQTPFVGARSLPENAAAGPSTGPAEATEDEEDITIGDDEVNTAISIPIPMYATPTHTTHPVFVSHKIKWSCTISNPDGHVSELRCALPIIVLDHSLLEEARTAGAPTRSLLCGTSAEESQQVDLPSYSNHVYDRVAADTGATAGYVSRSVNATPLPSPHHETPPQSRTPSRPASPTHHHHFETDEPIPAGPVPPRPQLDHWADSELLLSLGALRTHSNGSSPHDTPGDSRSPSRPLSRRNSRSGPSSLMGSRPGSRGGSRASSPERRSSGSEGNTISERRGSGITGRIHLPTFSKSLRPMTSTPVTAKPILRNTSGAALAEDTLRRNANSFGNLSGGHVRIGGETRRHFVVDPEEDVPLIRRTPGYDAAMSGFPGAIDSRLPTYDASETFERTRSETDLARPRSDTHLVALGQTAGELADAEERAAE